MPALELSLYASRGFDGIASARCARSECATLDSPEKLRANELSGLRLPASVLWMLATRDVRRPA